MPLHMLMAQKASLFFLAVAVVGLVNVRAAVADPRVADIFYTNGTADDTFKSEEESICLKFDPAWGPLPSGPRQLALVHPPLGCSESNPHVPNVTNPAALSGKWAVFTRGVCNFTTKVDAAIAAGAAGVIIVNAGVNKSWIAPQLLAHNNATNYGSLPMGMVSNFSGARLANLAATSTPVTVREAPPVDPNIALFLAIALISIGAGGAWGTWEERARLFGRAVPTNGNSSSNDNNNNRSGNEGDKARQGSGQTSAAAANANHDGATGGAFGVKTVAVLLVVATAALLLMFFFYQYVVYVVIGIFTLGGTAAVQRVLGLALSWCWSLEAQPKTKVKWIGEVSAGDVMCLILAAGLAATWVVERHVSPTGWILQDIMGLCLMASFLEGIYLTTLRTGTILGVVFLFYDVFMVFITPLFTPNGDSVMVKAATGGGTSSERMPLLFILPRIASSPCSAGISMLGFGDVIVPGLLCTLGLRFDIARLTVRPALRKRWLPFRVFATALFGYLCGLALCWGVMAIMRSPQPALLYLCPSILTALWTFGLVAGEWRDMWEGMYYRPGVRARKQARARARAANIKDGAVVDTTAAAASVVEEGKEAATQYRKEEEEGEGEYSDAIDAPLLLNSA